MNRALLLGVLALGAVGCQRHESGSSQVAAQPSASASVSRETATTTDLGPVLAALDVRVEARRGTVSGADPLLVRHRAALEAHFGVKMPEPLSYQAAAVYPDRAALLLSAAGPEPKPLVWLLDTKGEIIWAKEHPVGGVKPGVSELTILPGPSGHVCLAWCNGSTDSIALRRWDEEGAAFADYDALHADACDAFSAIYWPRRGWVLAIARKDSATLALVNENGERVWGNDGMSLPWTWISAAPISLALDTEDTLLLFRLGQSGAAGTGQYVFASRWSADGRPMWPGPLSVKRLPSPVRDPLVRITLEPGADGTIRAVVPASALVGSESVAVEVASDGSVTRR